MATVKARKTDNAADKSAAQQQEMVGDLGVITELAPPEQRVFDGTPVPLCLTCARRDAIVEDVCRWVEENQAELESLLKKHGGILFRGFPLSSAEKFDHFVKSFKGWEDLPYEESLSFAVRLDVVGRVCTTNEGKKGGQVFHHEQAQTPHYPSRLFFYCERPATTGGGTAICPSDVVLKNLEAKYPDFVKDCETKGIKYTSYMLAEADPANGVGRSWKSFFGRETREEVEARMRELGYTWEWLENDCLKATSPALPAVRTDKASGKRVFFNQLVAQVANAKEFSARAGQSESDVETSLSKYLTFGDGTPVPVQQLKDATQMCEDAAIELMWQPGDVGLLDNMLVMHARRSFEGPRRVLASLVR